MKFALLKNGDDIFRDEIANEVVNSIIRNGHEVSPNLDEVNFVLNLTSFENPRAFRRKSKSIFVISILSGENLNGTLRSACYTTLIRTLSNLLICAVRNSSNETEIFFTTPEAGYYSLQFNPDEVFKRILPIASAHFATDNLFSTDLPEKYWNGSPVTEKIREYGKELDNLGVLPTPFPLREVLSENELNHLYKILGITGASYGNLSARENIPEIGKTTFWMTGRGVNKSDIKIIGKDVLLVKGFDFENGTALLSMPANFNPKARVSVDAVEHSLIYQTFPEVGAIIHLHAWVDGVLCTHQNYPCGTIELAKEVVGLLKRTEDPSRAAVGLKNHGLTITGHNLDEIFSRIRGKLKTEVEMFA